MKLSFMGAVEPPSSHNGRRRTARNCGAGELKIIAAILERPVVEKILTQLGLDPQPPPNGRAREPGQDFAA
jgi:hypothetical protein